MKKLFLLPAIALIAVLAVTLASAGYNANAGCCRWYDTQWHCSAPVTLQWCSNTITDPDVTSGVFDGWNSACLDGYCIPEFTSLGAGIALIGAGAGYALIRRKRK